MKLRVKICGITNVEDALLVAQEGADALGFIFYDRSPRYISPEDAASIIRQLPPFVTPVGVFVNADRGFIDATIERTNLRVIQLSGNERPEDCIGHRVKVIKSFRIRDAGDVQTVSTFAISAAMLDGARDGEYGGTGCMADFTIAKEIRKFHPLILAGGLNPSNILDAVRAAMPYAVDVNSGVELTPGKKDPEKLESLFRALSTLSLHEK